MFRKSESLKGIAKWKYDREHKEMLELYPHRLKEFHKIVPKGEKIEVEKWHGEVSGLLDKRFSIEEQLDKEVGELACVEVIDYNKANEARERSNEVHQKEKEQERVREPQRKRSYPER